MERKESPAGPFTPPPTAQRSVYFAGQNPSQSMYAQERQSFFNSRRPRSQPVDAASKEPTAAPPTAPLQNNTPSVSPDIKVDSSGSQANPPRGGWFGYRHLFSEYCYNKPEPVNLGRTPVVKQDRITESQGDDSGETSGEETGPGSAEKALIPVRSHDFRRSSSESLSNWTDRDSTNKTLILPDGSVGPAGPPLSAQGGFASNQTELNSLKIDHEQGRQYDFIKPSSEYFAGRENARPVHPPRDSRIFPPETHTLTSEPKATSMWSKLFSLWSHSSYGSNK
ncbi:unnamed protein product [Bursaphelenchus xylophilus]|nr:unnamed protein product [Bursaphelenchus xylophilus]CAG9094847.1 unnamed protein product [Bursaphelenchus xylophilus]